MADPDGGSRGSNESPLESKLFHLHGISGGLCLAEFRDKIFEFQV